MQNRVLVGIILISLKSQSFASDLKTIRDFSFEGEGNLSRIEEYRIDQSKEKTLRSISKPQKVRGNLPSVSNRTGMQNKSESHIIATKFDTKSEVIGLISGEILEVLISQDIIGYEGSISPVRAVVASGELKGLILIGNATMDKITKSILISFNSFRKKSDVKLGKLNAAVLDPSGRLGLKGEFNTHYWQQFWAGVLARSASGIANISKEYNHGSQAGIEVVPSIKNQIKNGISEGFSEVSDNFNQKTKETPEYTVAKGPHMVRVFVLESGRK